ncbi:hypothetical protein NQ318_010249 [Aromia moschata]|uniref:Uncharacterized protein n=1 Tax=Aromia moschata TaxID=1265417 RepID=A0AAV8YKX3_9CUCU|nr:hypothetical protein NQ318_010249 [Aromia moschata]
MLKYEVCKLSNETGNVAPDLATLRRQDLEGRNVPVTKLFSNDIMKTKNSKLVWCNRCRNENIPCASKKEQAVDCRHLQ